MATKKPQPPRDWGEPVTPDNWPSAGIGGGADTGFRFAERPGNAADSDGGMTAKKDIVRFAVSRTINGGLSDKRYY
jgi:hypothetical protein